MFVHLFSDGGFGFARALLSMWDESWRKQQTQEGKPWKFIATGFHPCFFWDLMDVINGVLGFFWDQGSVSGEDKPEFGIHFSYTAGV